MGDVLAGKGDGLAGLGIAPHARGAIVQREAAEATDLDAIAARQRIAHDLEQMLDRELDVFRGQMLLLPGDYLDQFRLRHRCVRFLPPAQPRGSPLSASARAVLPPGRLRSPVSRNCRRSAPSAD